MNPLAAIAGLPRWAKIAGLVAVLAGAVALWLALHDAVVVERHDAAVNLRAEQSARAADNQAAGQQLNDAATIAAQEEAYDQAIRNAPGGAPAPAAVALGCERLRRAGKVDASLPAVCRHRGAAGSEAGSP